MVFRVVKEKVEIESQVYNTFGIGVTFDNGDEKVFSDISFNFDTISDFVDALNTHNPEAMQIDDLIEDFMMK